MMMIKMTINYVIHIHVHVVLVDHYRKNVVLSKNHFIH